jgi:hypothetical protein
MTGHVQDDGRLVLGRADDLSVVHAAPSAREPAVPEAVASRQRWSLLCHVKIAIMAI